MNVIQKKPGIAMAIAAASLMSFSGASSAAESSTAELVHCSGVNKCGGHNDCKTADNACKGQAACKGHGFVLMSAEACDHVGGEVTK